MVAGGLAAALLVGAAVAVFGGGEPAGSAAAAAVAPSTSLATSTTTTTVDRAEPDSRPELATDCRTWPDPEATIGRRAGIDLDALGVWVIDLADGCSYGVNGSAPIYAASTIKLLALAGLLESAQAEGRELTEDERELATAMMQYSDNDAASLLIDRLEWRGESFADLGARWGIPGAQNPTWGLSHVTAAQMAGLVAELFDGSRLGPAAEAEAKAFLDLPDGDFASGWRVAVGYGLPTGWYYGSKVGELVTDDGGLHLHGVGLVESPGGHRYAVAVLSFGWYGYGDTEAAMAELNGVGGQLSCLMTSAEPDSCAAGDV
jgi:hypothetical protein